VLARHGPVKALAGDAWSRGLLVVGNGGEGAARGAAWGATPAANVALQQLPAGRRLNSCRPEIPRGQHSISPSPSHIPQHHGPGGFLFVRIMRMLTLL
jgi:hypothetical protein